MLQRRFTLLNLAHVNMDVPPLHAAFMAQINVDLLEHIAGSTFKKKVAFRNLHMTYL